MKTLAFRLFAPAIIGAVLLASSWCVAQEPAQANASAAEASPDSLALFERRILPILRSPKPSSCSECHLSGVDLKDYIRPTQQQTFASLRKAGLIDVATPEKSKLLEFLRRRPEKVQLATERMRQEELSAFESWIRAAALDPALLSAADAAGPIGPTLPVEVIRHARQDRVLASFVENVWNEVGRCAACHSPDRNQKQVQEHGEQVSWIRMGDPEGTLAGFVEAGLIDVENPEQSLLLAKPTMQVEHGGGQKAVVGDRTYKQFRRFLDDYAAAAKGEYAAARELPRPPDEVSFVTDIWLKLEGVPSEYDKALLQVDLYAKTPEGWTSHRVATSDRPVFGPKQLWQHSLSLTAPRDSKQAAKLAEGKLPSGEYLAKVYVDREGKLAKDFRAELGPADLVGELRIESRWSPGYGSMTVARFPAELKP